MIEAWHGQIRPEARFDTFVLWQDISPAECEAIQARFCIEAPAAGTKHAHRVGMVASAEA